MKTNLFKKMTSMLLAVMMLLSVIPMMASATETTATSDGKFWQTLSFVTMDDYEATTGATGGVSAYYGKKSDNSGWIVQGSGAYSNEKYFSIFKTSGGSMRLHHQTGLRAYSESETGAVPGASVSNVLRLNRAWSMTAGSWDAGMGKGSPDSYMLVSGLFDKTDVEVGDTVKVTVWIQNKDLHSATTSADSNIANGGIPEDSTSTFSMWLADKATDGAVGTLAADYNNTPSPTLYGDEYVTYDNLASNEWLELSLTYTVTDSNKDVTGIAMNSDKLDGTNVEVFPLYLFLGAVKVEKLMTPSGKYILEDGNDWENISTVTMDGYTLKSDLTDGNLTTYWQGTKTIDNRVSCAYLKAGSTSYYPMFMTLPPSNGSPTKRIHYGSGLEAMPYGSYTWPQELGTQPDSAYLLELSRHQTNWWSITNYSLAAWAGAGYGDPNSSINITNLFDESLVSTGDKIKITAYVQGQDMHSVTEPADGNSYGNSEMVTSAETTAAVRMWLSETTEADQGGVLEDDVKYNDADPDTSRKGEFVYDTMRMGQWKKLSIIYTVDDTNKNISSIRIDSDNATHDVTHFPFKLALAGVTVEKAIPSATETAGKITGEVILGGFEPAEGENNQVIIAAYDDETYADGIVFLDCTLAEYTGQGTYTFTIDEGLGATKVLAYVWEMGSLEPQIVPLELVEEIE